MTCIHIYSKSTSPHKISFIQGLCISLTLSILTYFLNAYSTVSYYIIPLIILWIIISLLNTSPQKSFVAITISFTLSLCIYAISTFTTAAIMVLLFNRNSYFLLHAIATGLVQFLITNKLINLKRFKKGISFLLTALPINFLTVFCLALVCFPLQTIKDNSSFHKWTTWIISFIPYILILAFLIYWWQAQITKAYRRNLELRELESMRTEMAELKKQMEALKTENDRLARITHRDNTLISALKNSTVKYLSTDFANPAVAEEVRNQLIENINTLSAERASLMTAHKEVSAREFATGLSLLDTLLHEMDEKALEMKITFAVHMGISLNEFIPNVVLESDLVHTVDDLLKNAFKATRSSEKRVVQLQFYKLGKNLVIEVADSGIPFEVKSLVNMGVEKLTTYEDGSGIGLMDIWNTKESYGATYHLEECVNAAPFTKKISLTFDKKNRYSIRTLRKDEILQASRRADLQVYDFSE